MFGLRLRKVTVTAVTVLGLVSATTVTQGVVAPTPAAASHDVITCDTPERLAARAAGINLPAVPAPRRVTTRPTGRRSDYSLSASLDIKCVSANGMAALQGTAVIVRKVPRRFRPDTQVQIGTAQSRNGRAAVFFQLSGRGIPGGHQYSIQIVSMNALGNRGGKNQLREVNLRWVSITLPQYPNGVLPPV